MYGEKTISSSESELLTLGSSSSKKVRLLLIPTIEICALESSVFSSNAVRLNLKEWIIAVVILILSLLLIIPGFYTVFEEIKI